MGGQDRVVGLNHSGRDLGSWVYGKLQLRLFAIIDAQPLHKQGGESGSGTSSEAVEDEESLETSTLVSQLTDAVQDQVNKLFADCVVTSGVVVGGVLLASDELLRVEELAVGTSTNLI